MLKLPHRLDGGTRLSQEPWEQKHCYRRSQQLGRAFV
jgi:hypothetical protein